MSKNKGSFLVAFFKKYAVPRESDGKVIPFERW